MTTTVSPSPTRDLDDLQCYVVGGAVRDSLLGLTIHDRDWVVVGSTPQQMLQLGFIQVGKDFPVFLHPQTKEEYALARSERKSGHGYHGFTFISSPDVTLEQDLSRRDITINAMAKDKNGEIIDPFGGQSDIDRKIIRHVTPAFSEDPLRLLRLARFASRLPDFSIAPTTLELLREIVHQGEVDHLASERVWQEISRGLMTDQPRRMFEVLRDCNSLAKLLPEVNALFGIPQRSDHHPEIDCGVHTMMVLDITAKMQLPLAARFAALVHDLGKATTPTGILPRHYGHEKRSVELILPLCKRLRVPKQCRDFAVLVACIHSDVGRITELRPSSILKLLLRMDVLRRPQRLGLVLDCCEADYRGRLGFNDKTFQARAAWQIAYQALKNVDIPSIVSNCKNRTKISVAIYNSRLAAIKKSLPSIRSVVSLIN